MFGLVTVALGFSGDEVLAKVNDTRALRQYELLGNHSPEISEAMYRAAAEGKVETALQDVPGHKAKIAYAVGILDVGIGKFYAAVNDDASKPSYTKLSYTEVLRGGACGLDRDVFMYLPVTMLTDRYWITNARQNTALSKASGGKVRQMTWETIAPNVPAGTKAAEHAANGMPIEFAKGAWYLTELDATHTLVEYWTWTDPGGYIPAGLASSFASGGIKDTYETMAQLAQKGAKCAVQ